MRVPTFSFLKLRLHLTSVLTLQLPSGSFAFTDFRSLWEEMKFQYIFSSAPDNITRVDWFNVLIDSVFGAPLDANFARSS